MIPDREETLKLVRVAARHLSNRLHLGMVIGVVIIAVIQLIVHVFLIGK